jgi:hypothetical protein
MVYIQDFYPRYEEYLKEKIVRHRHQFAFHQFASFTTSWLPAFQHKSYVDFGCGTCEFNKYYLHNGNDEYPTNDKYAGIDLNDIKGNLVGDYLKMSGEEIVGKIGFKPTIFISLFSSEIMQSAEDKYNFYSRIFREIPSICSGMVSGFYYKSKANELRVEENGNLLSWQSIEHPRDWMQKEFFETTMYFDVPSKMWGEDVIEVWKFFGRKI